MEFKTLILGLAFSLGIFALKNGLGLHYLLMTNRGRAQKILLVFGLYVLVYAGIFSLSWWVLQKVAILDHFQTFLQVMRSGMLIHLLLAALLTVWGMVLLTSKQIRPTTSWGWVPLVMPCPVCALVIFFNVSLLLAFFPQAGIQPLILVWAGFSGLGLCSALLLALLLRRIGTSPESVLGSAMIFLAAFFVLSVIVMPQISRLDAIYSLASYQGEPPLVSPVQAVAAAALTLTAFAVGFAIKRQALKG